MGMLEKTSKLKDLNETWIIGFKILSLRSNIPDSLQLWLDIPGAGVVFFLYRKTTPGFKKN